MPDPPRTFTQWLRTSLTAKLITIGVLLLFLLIPALLLDALIYERLQLRDRAQTEVSSKWGLQQTVGGPVLSVPYIEYKANDEGEQEVDRRGYAHFLPELLDIDGRLSPENRYRGIYVVVLYNSVLQIKGQFGTINESALNLQPNALQWDQSLITLGISDMTGINSAIEITVDSQRYRMGPGTITDDIFKSGASIPIDLSGERSALAFDLELNLNGSSALFFRPFAQTTQVALRGEWSDPSYAGQFLPKDRSLEDNQFAARWEVLQLNRNYPQQGLGNFIPDVPEYINYTRTYSDFNSDSNSDRFGLRLLLPVDEYKKTERSTKYAMLFVFITFLTFFFIEVLNKQRLHPIQYLLIGAAVILFYILLLSISEHLNFNKAYWISCVAIAGLITSYSWYILKNGKLTLLVCGVLLLLYLFFYSLLQLQELSFS